EENQYIDNIITLIEKNGRPSIAKNILQLKDKFDTCVAVYPTFTTALILFLSNIPTRIGTAYRWYSFLFNKKIYEHRKFGNRHELEYNVRLLLQTGIDENVNEENVSFGLVPSKESEEKVRYDLREFGVNLDKPILIVHPGSGGSSIDLPVEKMKAVIKLLAQGGNQILITGTNSEKELCESFALNKKIFNTAGKYNLKELTALINQCDLMIANSTGPIHIAAALGKGVIGFYPKFAAASAKRWGPYTTKKKIFSPAIDCNNCTRNQCEKLNCMESISAEEVVETAQNILAKIASEKNGI
ncbi:MAG: glycosyltransferase family 9 protein, partial [Bacteroidota bacterium]